MKPIKRPVHTFAKALSKAKTAIRFKRADKDSPAFDAEIAHYKAMAFKFAKTDTERALVAAL
jgi:hypothetical protein